MLLPSTEPFMIAFVFPVKHDALANFQFGCGPSTEFLSLPSTKTKQYMCACMRKNRDENQRVCL